jgi:hypothetical protein
MSGDTAYLSCSLGLCFGKSGRYDLVCPDLYYEKLVGADNRSQQEQKLRVETELKWWPERDQEGGSGGKCGPPRTISSPW